MATQYTAMQSFFSTPKMKASTASIQKKVAFVNVGGNGDCGFRSVAAGFLDNFIAQNRVKNDVLAKVLKKHFQLFPSHCTHVAGLVTPSERMQMLLDKISTPELIPSLGFTLRQLAVDELVANPSKYRGAFTNINEGTSPESMRKENTWIDESAIAAIAQVLQTPIKVKVVQADRELPYSLNYNEQGTNPKIVVQLQNKHYVPRVANVERFSKATSLAARNIAPQSIENTDKSIEQILKEIAEDDKRINSEFEANKTRLTTMVFAGELNKKDLVTLYVNGMNNSDYLQGRTKYVGIEHGNQHFFETLRAAQKGQEVVSPQKGTYDEQVVAALIGGIARAVSIGQMDPNVVFEHLDNKQESRAVSMR